MTTQQLKDKVDQLIFENTSGQVSPTDVNELFKDVIDSTSVVTRPVLTAQNQLFDISVYLSDTSIGSTGVIGVYPSAPTSLGGRTAKIEITDSDRSQLIVSGMVNVGTSSKRWAFYNIANTLLTYGNIGGPTSNIISIPVGARYFYIQYKHASLDPENAGDDMMVNYGNIALPYEPYDPVIKDILVSVGGAEVSNSGSSTDMSEYAKKSYVNAFQPYQGKTLVTLGDSITRGLTWQPALVNFTGMIFDPSSVNSSTKPTGLGGSKIKPIIVSGTTGQEATQSIYYRADYVVDYAPDVIILMGGQNDGRDATYNLSDPVYLGAEKINTDSNLPSFVSSYKGILEKLITQNPSSKIIVLTPFYTGNVPSAYTPTVLASYKLRNDTIKSICEMYSIQCIDLMSDLGIHPINNQIYTTDGIHPNAVGGLKIATLIASKL